VEILLPVFQRAPSREKIRSVSLPERTPVPEKKNVRPKTQETPLVLFMDDDPMIRHITEKILVRLGYAPVLAENGEEAVAQYKSMILGGQVIAAVILDLEVKQGMGGIETLALLTDLNPEIKVIVASGYPEDVAMENYKAFGFADSLAKPISVQNLKKALEKLL
jgi:CheY-like chemotaxis protein